MNYANRLASFLRIHSNESRMVALVTGMMFFASAGGAIGSPGVEALLTRDCHFQNVEQIETMVLDT